MDKAQEKEKPLTREEIIIILSFYVFKMTDYKLCYHSIKLSGLRPRL